MKYARRQITKSRFQSGFLAVESFLAKTYLRPRKLVKELVLETGLEIRRGVCA
jgi:hypothetical protein